MDSRLTYILTVCFGVASWVTINGIFSILPSIISQLPEGWAIASTLGLTIQAANIGPLIYRLSRTSFEMIPIVVHGILAFGVLSMVLLACFWNVTTEIMGSPCSIMLILLTFTAALCDCTSSVVFWPFIGALAPAMISGLALGENLSGVVASAVSLLGLSPGMSFCALAVVLIISGVAFSQLQQEVPSAAIQKKVSDHAPLLGGGNRSPTLLYLVVGVTSLFENAVLPSVLPYATARYSLKDYHIASTIPVVPLALFTLTYFQVSRATIAVMAAGAAGGISLIIWIGLGHGSLGGNIAILLVVIVKTLLAYSKAASMYHLKVGALQSDVAQQQLETAGGLMQVWSLGGAVIMFTLIRLMGVFPEKA